MATQEVTMSFVEPATRADSAMSIDTATEKDTKPDADAALESQMLAAATAGDLDLIKSVLTTSSPLLPQIVTNAAKAKQFSILSWCFTLPSESLNNQIFTAACETGSIPLFQILLDHGLDLNRHSSEYYGDALACACMKGNVPLVKFLLEKGHAVNSGRRCMERLAVVWAVMCDGFSQDDGLEILKLLLKHGVNVEGIGAGIAAAERDNLDALVFLLNAGVGMEERCSWWGNCEKMGNEEWGTALFRACAKGKTRTVEYLIGRGAKTDAEGSEGSSCYDVAEGKRYHEVLRMLHVMGVTVEWPD